MTDDANALTLAHMVLPARRRGDGPAPGLLLLHGRGADERDLLSISGVFDARLTAISARAPFPLGPGYHWCDLTDDGMPDPASYADARARLAAFIDEAVAAYGLDPARLYLLGFSQGAMMAGGLALTMPARIAGAVLLSGWLPANPGQPIDADGLRGLPIFVGHGADDQIIPVRYGRRTRDELARLGADVTYREYPISHVITPDELTDIAAWLTARIQDLGVRIQGEC
jgi:phospholipase/carboxylesterase